MLHDVAVRCSDIKKTYVVPGRGGLGFLLSKLRSHGQERYVRRVEALRGVSFEVARGEVFGILGHNGAGKSTLLACLAGITNYDAGTIDLAGRVDGLLQLGVGFHPQFTSRENALIGSIAMGIPAREAKEAVKEVIEFAELEAFADIPYYAYSDGMMARLKFAVAMQRRPDVLLIDEALGVGDGYFVGKCHRRIEDICKSGSTVIVVSHSVSMIESLCQRAMILDHGKVVDIGPAVEVGTRYRKLYVDKQFRASRDKQMKLADATHRDTGTGEVAIQDVSVSNDDPSAPSGSYVWWNHPMSIRVRLIAKVPIENPRFVLQIFTGREGILVAHVDNTHVSAVSGNLETADLGTIHGDKMLEIRIPRCPLGGNQYYVSFGMLSSVPRHKIVDLSDYYVFRRVAAYFQVISFPDHPSTVTRTVLVEPEITVGIT